MAASKPSSSTTWRHFSLAAGDAHDAAALELGDLADEPADGAGGAGHDHRLALLRLADVEQAEVGGHAGHAERAQVDGQRRERRCRP